MRVWIGNGDLHDLFFNHLNHFLYSLFILSIILQSLYFSTQLFSFRYFMFSVVVFLFVFICVLRSVLHILTIILYDVNPIQTLLLVHSQGNDFVIGFVLNNSINYTCFFICIENYMKLLLYCKLTVIIYNNSKFTSFKKLNRKKLCTISNSNLLSVQQKTI